MTDLHPPWRWGLLLACLAWLAGVASPPLMIDWIVADNTPASRFATGVVASFPVALLALLALAQRGERIPTDLKE